MPVNLSIKEVPEALAQRLRERAARNHRSMQGELMAIIEQAVESSAERRAGASDAGRHGTKSIREIAAELRALYPEPVTGAPKSVDIVRHMRDSR